MIVEVKKGNQIIYRGGNGDEIRSSKMKMLLGNQTKVPFSVLKKLLQDDLSLVDQLRKNLNPEVDESDRLLCWRLEALLNLTIKPNISKKFSENFFPTGYMPGELYVLSGISGGGKTSFAVHIATTLASGVNCFSDLDKEERATVIYLSLEQSKKQIEARVLSNLCATLLGNKNLSFSEVLCGDQTFSKEFEEALWGYLMIEDRIRIFDSSYFGGSPTVQEITAFLGAELLKIGETEKKLIIIDRLENIIGGTSNLDDTVVITLKNFASQQNVPVLVQCQMSKNAIETARTSDGGFNMDKLSASSLKGTSGLEHNCSNVMILVPDGRKKEISQKSEKIITIIQPKNRYGRNDRIKMSFLGSCGLFAEYIETRGRKKKEPEEVADESV